MKRFILLVSLCVSFSFVHAAGVAFIDIPADSSGPGLRGVVWSPCAMPPVRMDFPPLVLAGVRDCPISARSLPLIVISHGTGGSYFGHHDTAAALADAGFVVAAINHPGDNFLDPSRQTDLSVFASRPTDMRRLVDYMLTRWPQHDRLNANKIGLFGFSRGGYTGLVAMGAIPNWTSRQDLCPAGSSMPLCRQILNQAWPKLPPRDARIKAAVIVDPLSVFDANGVKQISVPIQLWASEYGGDGVTPQSVMQLRQDLPLQPEWHVASGAGHFAFLAPCSTAMTHALPALCQDPAGFDRVAFHADFNSTVRSFFAQYLM